MDSEINRKAVVGPNVHFHLRATDLAFVNPCIASGVLLQVKAKRVSPKAEVDARVAKAIALGFRACPKFHQARRSLPSSVRNSRWVNDRLRTSRVSSGCRALPTAQKKEPVPLRSPD